jgi:hypothetical protein
MDSFRKANAPLIFPVSAARGPTIPRKIPSRIRYVLEQVGLVGIRTRIIGKDLHIFLGIMSV